MVLVIREQPRSKRLSSLFTSLLSLTASSPTSFASSITPFLPTERQESRQPSTNPKNTRKKRKNLLLRTMTRRQVLLLLVLPMGTRKRKHNHQHLLKVNPPPLSVR